MLIKKNPYSFTSFRKKSFLFFSILCVVILAPFLALYIYNQKFIMAGGILALMLTFASATIFIKIKDEVPRFLAWVISALTICMVVFGIHTASTAGTYWAYPAIVTFFIILERKDAIAFNVLLFAALGYFSFQLLENAITVRCLLSSLMVALVTFELTTLVQKQSDFVKYSQSFDTSTGLFNSIYLFEQVKAKIYRANKASKPLGIIKIQAFNYKYLKEVHGIEKTEQFFLEVGQLISKHMHISNENPGFKLSGVEYLILVSDQSVNNAQLVANELKKELDTLCKRKKINAELRMAVTGLKKDEGIDALLARTNDLFD